MCSSKLWDPKFTKFSYKDANGIITISSGFIMTVCLGLVFSSQKEVTNDIGQIN